MPQAATVQDATAQQDALRPLRQFVGLLSVLTNEQTWANADQYATNQPYQYQAIGPTGVAVEGAPIATTNSGGLVISNGLLMLGLGVVAALVLLK